MKFLKRLLVIITAIILTTSCFLLIYFLKLNKGSGITGEGLTFDKTFYPYCHFLSADGQTLYAQVYANAKAKEQTFKPVVEMKISEVANVVSAVFHDHPELFWMNNGYTYKYDQNDICVLITLDFNIPVDEIEKHEKIFEEKAQDLIYKAKTKPTEYGQEKYVYNYIIDHTNYDASASMNQSPYSVLVSGRSVCAGYARAFQYIMIELGIPTYYCTGVSEGHAWNIVKLDDGYYNVDLTMANEISREGAFLNRTDDELSYTHKRSGYSTLLPKCTATKYKSDSQ